MAKPSLLNWGMNKSREDYNTYMREYMRQRYERRRSESIRLLGGRCAKCGASEHLNFDHVDAPTKSFDIARRLAGVSEAKLQRELQKCQLLCATCHQVKTTEVGEHQNAGSNNHAAKLTEAKVLEARRRWRRGCRKNGTLALAREFGVHRRTMEMALKRKTWKHV